MEWVFLPKMIRETDAEYQADAGSTKDTPYLALTVELWIFVRKLTVL